MLAIIILITIIVLFITFLGFKRAFGSLSIETYMPHSHLFYYQIVAMTLVASIVLGSGVRSNLLVRFNITDASVELTLICIWYMLIALSIGLMFFMRNINVRTYITQYSNKELLCAKEEISKLFYVLCSLVAVFCVFYLYSLDAPIFQLLKGNMGSVLTSRVAYGRDFGGSAFIKNILGQHITVAVSYITFLYYRKYKKNFWRNIFVINFICALIISSASLSKAGTVDYLIPYLFLYTMTGKRLRIRTWIPYICVLSFIVLLAYYIQAGGARSYWEVLFDVDEGPIGRIFFVQLQSLPAYFMIFPESCGFLLGKSIPILNYVSNIFVESARIVATYLEPEGVAAGYVGVANTLFLGDAYANFGWIGIIISPFIVAFWFAFFYKKLLFIKKTPENLAGIVMILYSLVSSFTGGFCSGYLFNTQIVTILFLIMGHNIFCQIMSGDTKIVISKGWWSL